MHTLSSAHNSFEAWNQALRQVCGRFESQPTLNRTLFIGDISRQDLGGLELALLILPLYIPVLILGSGALQASLQGLPSSGHLLWLASLTALALTLTPFAIAAGLKISVGE